MDDGQYRALSSDVLLTSAASNKNVARGVELEAERLNVVLW